MELGADVDRFLTMNNKFVENTFLNGQEWHVTLNLFVIHGFTKKLENAN